MAAMKVTEWPKYQKTGSSTEKKRRQVQHIATLIFAELFARHTEHGKPRRSTATPLRTPGRNQRQPIRGS